MDSHEALPITTQVRALLRTRGKSAARQAHRDAVRLEFQAAQDGAVINLSDLMASREALEEDGQ